MSMDLERNREAWVEYLGLTGNESKIRAQLGQIPSLQGIELTFQSPVKGDKDVARLSKRTWHAISRVPLTNEVEREDVFASPQCSPAPISGAGHTPSRSVRINPRTCRSFFCSWRGEWFEALSTVRAKVSDHARGWRGGCTCYGTPLSSS
jgi:hypothetical protein